MDKIIYLARKLKAFTFEDIFMLAEISKENLEQKLKTLIDDGIIKEDSQGYVFIATSRQIRNQQKRRIEIFIETTESKKFKEKQPTEKPQTSERIRKRTQNFGIFAPQYRKFEKSSFYELVSKFLERYVANFCTRSTFQTYESLCRNNILPFFKGKAVESIDINTIREFYEYCEYKKLSPRRFKNTMALLKQLLNYAKENGMSNNAFDFQVKRLSPKNEFNLNRIKFSREASPCF